MIRWPKHFKPEDFDCPCCGKADMDQAFLDKLQEFRIAAATPMVITSGFRCPSYNKKIGGSKGSQHMLGKAVDISVITSSARYKLVKYAYLIGFKGIATDSAFIHLDTRAGEAVHYLYS